MKRKCLAVGIILLFVGTCVIPSIGQKVNEKPSLSYLTDKTIYVDDDNVQGPWDGTIEHPFQHIMDAIGVITNGDTIFVFNGWYNEDINLRYYENLNFNLTGENKVSTIIDGSVDFSFARIRFRINGFSIMGDLQLEAYGYTNDIIIEDNIFVHGGINIEDSYANIIRNNTFYSKPILLEFAKNNVIINNTFYSGGILFGRFYGKDNWDSHIIESNMINGKPIRYYKNLSNEAVPQDTGQLILVGCYNFTIKNLDISNVESGIQVAYSSENRITNCDIHDGSSNLTSGLPIAAGIKFYHSDYNTFENSTITKFNIGIRCSQIQHYLIFNCSIFYCYEGISLEIPSDIEISQNNISFNYLGINCYHDGFNINITLNVISHNTNGISLGGRQINITKNSIISNNNGVIISESFFISVKSNNFIQNNKHAYFQFSLIKWSGNYWGRSRTLPYIISGLRYKHLIAFIIWVLLIYDNPKFDFIPPPRVKESLWFNFDWHPAQEPYDIPGMR
jgi:hypothetical protein